MSIIVRFSERWLAPILMVGIACFGSLVHAGPPRGCIPVEQLPPLPFIRADNTPKQVLAHFEAIERIEIFDPVERRVITTLTGSSLSRFKSPIAWFAEEPEMQWIAAAQTIGPISRWRTVLLIHLKGHSEPFLAHPLGPKTLRMQRKNPWVRGDVVGSRRDAKTDLYVDFHHMSRLADAFESVRPLAHFCRATIRVSDCALERARASEHVHPPRIRRDNTVKQLLASRDRITRIKIWSRSNRGVVGELEEAEVATLAEKLGQANSPRNEWAGSPPMWDAVLLVYTRGNELPFAVHLIDQYSLRVGASEPMTPAIWEDMTAEEQPRVIAHDIRFDHDLDRILERFLGPEDPFGQLRFEREREVQRRCTPHSGSGREAFPHLPSARIEPADL
jgi:hypothetical protein